MPGWLDLMADSKIADSAEVTAPNGQKTTMGQVREAFLSREREVGKREEQINTSRKELADVFSLLQNEKVLIEAGKEEIRKQQEALQAALKTDTSGLDDDSAKLIKRLDGLEQALKDRTEENKKTNDTLRDAMSAYLDESWERTIKDYGEEVPEGLSKGDIARYAMDRNLVNKHKIPDLKRALDEITLPKRVEKEIKAAEKRGAEKAREEMAMAALGSPSGLRLENPNPDVKKYKSMDEAVEAATHDPEIMGLLSGTVAPDKWLY